MSSSLVKKSLELFKDDLIESTDKVQKKKKKPIMKQIGTDKYGVRRKLMKLKRQKDAEKQMQLLKKKPSCAADDVAKKQAVDMSDANILYFQQMQALTTTSSSGVAKLIVKQHRGKLAKNTYEKPKPEEKQRSILFSDRDFDQEDEEDDFWDEQAK